MNVYKIPVEYAFIAFPFVAFILTIPFLIHQYQKFGSIPLLKSACFYSMILYFICAYFLVILPLPTEEQVLAMTGPKTQLIPFQFIKDIIVTNSFSISSIKDVLSIFQSSAVYTVLFNFVLTIPFGIYLRYFFKKKWYHTFIYTFILSLFFELTQLSGLYGIYPRPYRLFDVDDLIINTIGGMLGYAITPLFTVLIPTIDSLEEKSYKKGENVTLFRRMVSLTIDILFIIFFSIVTRILLYNTKVQDYAEIVVLLLYNIIIPAFTSGVTIGKKIIRLQIVQVEGDKAKWYQILIRNIILTFIVLYPYLWIKLLTPIIESKIVSRLWISIIILQAVNISYYLYTIITTKPHCFLYEKITETINTSTIVYTVKESKQIEQ